MGPNSFEALKFAAESVRAHRLLELSELKDLQGPSRLLDFPVHVVGISLLPLGLVKRCKSWMQKFSGREKRSVQQMRKRGGRGSPGLLGPFLTEESVH